MRGVQWEILAGVWGQMGVTMGVCDAILYGLDRYRVMPRTVFSIWGVARWFPGIEKTEKNGVC